MCQWGRLAGLGARTIPLPPVGGAAGAWATNLARSPRTLWTLPYIVHKQHSHPAVSQFIHAHGEERGYGNRKVGTGQLNDHSTEI
jgi:hypothetical protein